MNSTAGWRRKYIMHFVCAVWGCFLLIASAAAAPGSNEANGPDPDSALPQPSASSAAGNQKEITELKQKLAEQQSQIEKLSVILQQQTNPSQDSGTTAGAQAQVASMVPMIPSAPVATASPVLPQAEHKEPEAAPLQFKLGSATFTPVGFMDFTSVFRDTDAGSGIGTNFGSIPYRTAASVPANLTEFRMSLQNSRIGMRVDATVHGTQVIGYWESDFLGGTGNPPVGNISVTTNSDAFRLRLYWVDLRKGKFEILGGQTWSLMTPGRKGISPLPADVFYTNDYDVNYHLGLVWGRIPEFRMVYHPSDKVAMALALGNPEQYIGGSGGSGAIVIPTSLASSYASELDNGTTVLAVPNVLPDIILKFAFDPTSRVHFEFTGLERTFRTYNPLTAQHFDAAGGGVEANFNLELLKNFRFVTNNYWSDGGGRYIFGQAPDLVIRSDGSPSLVKSGSTVSGFEFKHKSFQAYTYYGGVYIKRNVIVDPVTGSFYGYGYPGSANSQNRGVQEGTIGFIEDFWKDAKYGALSLMGQYAYFARDPWNIPSGTPRETHMNEAWLNLRYTLPGSAPSPK